MTATSPPLILVRPSERLSVHFLHAVTGDEISRFVVELDAEDSVQVTSSIPAESSAAAAGVPQPPTPPAF